MGATLMRVKQRITRTEIRLATYAPRIHFLIVWAGPLALSFVGLFIAGGLIEQGGFATAWNLIDSVTSPSAVNPAWMAYLLSVTGYLIVPAAIGVLVGVVVEARIASYRRPQRDVIPDDKSDVTL
jgi:hypothetical protein